MWEIVWNPKHTAAIIFVFDLFLFKWIVFNIPTLLHPSFFSHHSLSLSPFAFCLAFLHLLLFLSPSSFSLSPFCFNFLHFLLSVSPSTFCLSFLQLLLSPSPSSFSLTQWQWNGKGPNENVTVIVPHQMTSHLTPSDKTSDPRTTPKSSREHGNDSPVWKLASWRNLSKWFQTLVFLINKTWTALHRH